MAETVKTVQKPVKNSSETPVCSWPFNGGGTSPIAPVWTQLWNSAKLGAILVIAFGILISAVVWLVHKSFQVTEGTIYQELCVACAAAICTFLGTPIVIKLSAKHRWKIVPLMLALALICMKVAFSRGGVLRSLLVEGAVAIALIIGLELMFHQFVHVLHFRYKAAQDDLKEEEEWNQDYPFGPPRRPVQD